jgi:uncharacterized protein (DUF983 family)
MPDDRHYATQPPLSVGLAGRCPRCGQGRLFDGPLKIAPACRACGLEFHDPGDGAAMFVILIGNFLILGAALWFEFTLSPPFWLHLVIWPLLIIVLCVVSLRLIKGVLVALQFKHEAAEGRLER